VGNVQSIFSSAISADRTPCGGSPGPRFVDSLDVAAIAAVLVRLLEEAMADEEIYEQIRAVENEAKLTLLTQIRDVAAETTAASYLQKLSYAYALVVGGSLGTLPGGLIEVSK
jgi:hypothetical protein